MRRCLDLALVWATAVCLGTVFLWMFGDVPFADLPRIQWLVLMPGVLLVLFVVYFWFAERPSAARPRP